MFDELDTVALTRTLPEYGLEPGDIGAIVLVYGAGLAYEVEFVAADGTTIAVETLSPSDIRPVSAHEMLHARRRQPA